MTGVIINKIFAAREKTGEGVTWLEVLIKDSTTKQAVSLAG